MKSIRGWLRPAAALMVLVLRLDEPVRAERPPTIAAAASLNPALPALVAQFERVRGVHVEVVFGASGVLARQIREGAPFEMLLAADEESPKQLVTAGLTRDTGVLYAVGRLALFAPRGSPLTVDERLEGLASLLKSGRVTRFAIANPGLAPYGRAAEAVLRKRGLWDALQSRLALGDSIAQAAQFATSGNAVGGLIALSQAHAPGLAERGVSVPIPESDHPPIRHRMVLLKRAGAGATQFYAYIQSAPARALLERHGFTVPK